MEVYSPSHEENGCSFNLNKDTLIVYNHCEILGWGSFSFNFKGYMFVKNSEKKEVSIKEIKLCSNILSYDDISYKATMQEVQILKSVKHTNVIKFLGYQSFPSKKILIINKFCNQGDLMQFMKKNQFINQEAVIYFFAQILNAFKYLLSKKIFHRDIKPENIFLHNNKIKIADFGFALQLKGMSDKINEVKGSPGYMSPEIMNGEDYTIESDVWSLGVTLYYMLYEKLPWEDIKNPIKLGNLLKKKHEENEEMVDFPEKCPFFVSPELKDLIRKMLKYNAKERITWEKLFKEEFFKKKKKNKKPGMGGLRLLYKTKNIAKDNFLLVNYCSPSCFIEDSGKILIHEVKVSDYCNNINNKCG